MKTMKPNGWRAAQVLIRIALLVLIMLQVSVLTASASRNVYVAWGTGSLLGIWDGVGGSVSSTGYTVTNNNNISPKAGNTATITFTITPATGYVIDLVKWKDDDSNGFNIDTQGTALTPNTSNQVSFRLNDNNCSFEVRFKAAPLATNSFIAYYGTGAIDQTAATAPDWNGGQVFRKPLGLPVEIGGPSYLVNTYLLSGTKTFQIVPDTSPAYTIASVKYAEASWSDPRSVTVDASTIQTVSPDGGGNFSFTATSPKSYIIFVQFVKAGATGGKVGAWYGTNNTSDVDSPAIADGNGGTVYKTSSGNVLLPNREADSVSTSTDGSMSFEARPTSGFKIVSINYKESGAASWTNVTLGAPATSVNSFSIPVSGGKSYVIWVVFASTAPTSFSVTGSVSTDAITASCGTSSAVTPNSMIVNLNQTGSFTLSTSSNCIPDTVDFNGTGPSTVGLSGNIYTTPPITQISTFVVKFKPIGFKIDAYVDSLSPSGSGTISPATSGSVKVDVAKGGSQVFTISPSAGYSISHVYVTDSNRSYTNVDVAPLPNYTYTFTNVQADGVIKVSFAPSVPVAGNEYCQIPPFVQGQTNLSPNVLILFDNSGSMSDTPYKNIKSYNCDATHNATTKLCNSIFYGYFDPYTMYKPESSKSNVYLIDNVTLNLSASNGKSGNYLNYQNMSKVDIIRKVLVGGRVTGKGTTALAGRGTTANKFLYTDNGQWVEYGTGEPTGIIQDLDGKVRFGLEVLGTNSGSRSEGGRVIARLGSPKATLVTAIEGPNANPVTSTPMAEALYEAVRYYQAKPSAYNTSTDYGDSTWNPTTDPTIQYSCQKNFVLMLTDGEPNSNDNLPGLGTYPTLNGYTDGVFDVTTWESRIPADDRADNTNSTCSKVSYNNSAQNNTNFERLEGVAFFAHNTDLRSDTFGNIMAGNQNLTIYPVYAFGTGAGTKTLHMVAKYGAYDSYNGADAGTSPNQYPSPDQSKEWDKDDNCIPDAYFEGDDGAVLENGIKQVMSNILAKVASGTAASILSNSEGSGANLLQAVFYPDKIFAEGTEATWIGEMQNLWYYVDPFVNNSTIREDTDFVTTTPAHLLNLKNDYVANFIFDGTQTSVTLSQDTNGDGKAEVVKTSGNDPDTVKSLWRAGKQLWLKDPSARTIYTSTDGVSLLPGNGFHSDNKLALVKYLQAATNDSGAEAGSLINYIRGTDDPVKYRNRTVSILTTAPSTYTSNTWKLGDIVASTPKLESSIKLNNYDADPPGGYADLSYKKFIATTNYKNRGLVYVGANDGMFHAFKLGALTMTGSDITGDVKAKLTGSNLGEEQWAYVPRNVLPYLKYYTDRTNYKHLYYVDGPTLLADVAIGGCTGGGDYSTCTKDTTAGSNWRTVVIGSMGTGGASKPIGDTCTSSVFAGNCVKTPIYDPADTASPQTKGLGYSSYFAFDVTGQYFDATSGNLANAPVFKWEFSHPELGYATSGATIVKINTKITLTSPDGTTVVKAAPEKNGKWFAVIASGPTGPIDTTQHQFIAKSNQNLKFFVIDLGATIDSSHPFTLGTNYWILDSNIPNAFGGTMASSVIDTDRWSKMAEGNYEDDALYVGYTNANSSTITSTTEWTSGGVVRILTKGSTTPSDWAVSQVIKDIGPVTTSVAKLQDRAKKKLWLYFGTGRYYYSGDDTSNLRQLVAVNDGCYAVNNRIDKNCDTSSSGVGKPLTLSDLTNQSASCGTPDKGWYVTLRAADPSVNMSAERVLTDPSALVSGTVYYTSFSPTSDVCSFGGTSYLWALKFDNGCLPLCSGLMGEALLQMSTGAFKELHLTDLFSCTLPSGATRTPPPITPDPKDPPPPPGPLPPTIEYPSPPTPGIPGKPPGPPLTILDPFGNVPLKRMIHIKEQ